jgi:hypothetical protein
MPPINNTIVSLQTFARYNKIISLPIDASHEVAVYIAIAPCVLINKEQIPTSCPI